MDLEAAVTDPEDDLFVKVLLHNQLAEEAQVRAAIELYRRIAETGARIRIGEVLLHQGAIDTRTLDSVVNLQHSRFPDLRHPLALRRKGLTPERDRAIAEAAVGQGMVTQEKLDRARGIQQNLRTLGFDRRLGEVFWLDGDLTEEAVDRLLHEEKRRARADGDATRRLRSRVQVGPVSDAELLFGKYAVKNGFLTEDRLAEALEIQRQCREIGVALKLPEVLYHRKQLTEENVAQVAELMCMEKEQFLTGLLNRVLLKRLDDDALLAVLQERGFITPEQTAETLRVQARLRELRIERRAGEVLLDRKFVSTVVLHAALDEQLRLRLRAALKAVEAAAPAPAAPAPAAAPASAVDASAPAAASPSAPAVDASAPAAASATAADAPAPAAASPATAADDQGAASRQALRQAMVDAVRAQSPAAMAEAGTPTRVPVLGIVAAVVLACGLLYWALLDSAPRPSAGAGPGVATGGTAPVGPVGPVTPIDPPAHQLGIDPFATPVVSGVEHETEQAVREELAQERRERAEIVRRAHSLLADADPTALEVALAVSRTAEGVVFEVFGQAPVPDGASVATALLLYGEPIPEGAKDAVVQDRIFYARTGPIPPTRRPPSGLYTATAEFTATRALGSEEAIREAGVADRLYAGFSAVLGTPEEERAEAEQARAFHMEMLGRLEAFVVEARAAVDGGLADTAPDRWGSLLGEWRSLLQEVRATLAAHAQGALTPRRAGADQAIRTLLPIADRTLRAVATAAFAAHGAPVPDEFALKNLRLGEAVVPQEHLARLAGDLAHARGVCTRAWAEDPVAEHLRRDLSARAAGARALLGDLDQALAALREAHGVVQGGGSESSSPVSWLRKWLGQVAIRRGLDRGLQEQPAAAMRAGTLTALDDVLGTVAELGKFRFAVALKAAGRTLPVELRPLPSVEESRLVASIEQGLARIEKEAAR